MSARVKHKFAGLGESMTESQFDNGYWYATELKADGCAEDLRGLGRTRQATLNRLVRFGACALLVGASASGVAGQAPVPRCAPVAGETFDAAGLEGFFDELERDPTRDLRSIVVTRHGCLEAERYFNGDTAESLRDV